MNVLMLATASQIPSSPFSFQYTLPGDMYVSVDTEGCTIDWGDGIGEQSIASNTATQTTATTSGVYTGYLKGSVDNLHCGGSALNKILAWGTDPKSSIKLFQQLDVAPDFPTLTSTNISEVPPTLPSYVTRLDSVFYGATSFNQDLSGWDVSGVSITQAMFYGATSFNGDLSTWDTSAVTSMESMFYGATAFNGDLSGWNTGSVTYMSDMFRGASAFNQNIGSWDTHNTTLMDNMFYNATSFNQDLSGWCVSSIPSEPLGFKTGATAWVLAKPVWGTCP